jgi:hypothetical protein
LLAVNDRDTAAVTNKVLRIIAYSNITPSVELKLTKKQTLRDRQVISSFTRTTLAKGSLDNQERKVVATPGLVSALL